LPLPRLEEEESMRTRLVSLALALVVFAAVVAPLSAADTPVQRVIVVQADDLNAYLKELDTARAISKRLGGTGIIRAWRARFAGESAGSVVVTIEYASMLAYAKEEEKAQADPEEQALLVRLNKMRKIASDSLYVELKN
jgi:hypothetical protein